MSSTDTAARTAARSPNARGARRPRRRIGQPISRGSCVAISVATFGFLFVVWTIVSLLGITNERFLPAPWQVAVAGWEQAASGALWEDLGASVYRIVIGFVLATVMAVPIGALVGMSVRVEAAVQPLADFIRYMPVVAFVPLTILWIGIGEEQKFLIIWLGTFFQQVLLVADAVADRRALG